MHRSIRISNVSPTSRRVVYLSEIISVSPALRCTRPFYFNVENTTEIPIEIIRDGEKSFTPRGKSLRRTIIYPRVLAEFACRSSFSRSRDKFGQNDNRIDLHRISQLGLDFARRYGSQAVSFVKRSLEIYIISPVAKLNDFVACENRSIRLIEKLLKFSALVDGINGLLIAIALCLITDFLHRDHVVLSKRKIRVNRGRRSLVCQDRR